MCRYIEGTHTYSECKLQDNFSNSTPNPLASFFRRITKAALTTDSDPSPAFDLQSPHNIKQKTVIQCLNAAQDQGQESTPREERQCAELRAAMPEESVPARMTQTQHDGECPACKAAETAIALAMSSTNMLSVEFPLEPPAPRQETSQHHGPKRQKSKRNKEKKKKKRSRGWW